MNVNDLKKIALALIVGGFLISTFAPGFGPLIALAGVGVYFFGKKKSTEEKTPPISKNGSSPKKPRAKVKINVAGVTYDGRQEKLSNLSGNHGSEGNESSLEFVDDPENPHDPNAVKVLLHNEHVGYVPKKDIDRVKKVINESFSAAWRINKPDTDLRADDKEYYEENDIFNGYSVTIRLY